MSGSEHEVPQLMGTLGVVAVDVVGVDQDGELYFTDYNGGRIMQIRPAGGAQDNVPDLLSASGCVDASDITQPYSGMRTAVFMILL